MGRSCYLLRFFSPSNLSSSLPNKPAKTSAAKQNKSVVPSFFSSPFYFFIFIFFWWLTSSVAASDCWGWGWWERGVCVCVCVCVCVRACAHVRVWIRGRVTDRVRYAMHYLIRLYIVMFYAYSALSLTHAS